ncbi:hypothetical protein ACJ2A9_00505 [Anaerobacillus sp. MEB173]|uniref:hypothetical protein n=1 Tax=Anaerobacillus sp. MEB173 TaxID=3383345 RepID=UPI003F92C9C8
MNFKKFVCIGLLGLFTVTMPSFAFAEKENAHPSNSRVTPLHGLEVKTMNGTPEHVEQVKGQLRDKPEQVTENNRKVVENSVPTEKGKQTQSKTVDLPEHVNEKAEDAFNKAVDTKQELGKNKEKTLPDTRNNKAEEKPKGVKSDEESSGDTEKRGSKGNGNQVTKDNYSIHQEKAVHQQNQNISSTEESVSIETVEDTNGKQNNANKEQAPYPKKLYPEPHSFIQLQNTHNVSTSSSKDKGHSQSMNGFFAGVIDITGLTFKESFVLRQYVYRSQWTNAPPSPPPKNASSNLN